MKVQELFESSVTLTDEDVRDLAKAFVMYCTDWNVDQPLYRITKRVGLQQTKNRKMGSIAGSGNMWKWMHAQKEWQDFPDRQKSVFCSTSKNIAFGFDEDEEGGVKAVYPFSGIKFAISNKDFNANRIVLDGLDLPMRFIETVLSFFKGDLETDSNFSIQNAIQRCLTAAQHAELGDTEFFQTQKIAKGLSKNISPEDLGCKLGDAADVQKEKADEVWFEGRYIVVPLEKLDLFKQTVRELRDESK